MERRVGVEHHILRGTSGNNHYTISALLSDTADLRNADPGMNIQNSKQYHSILALVWATNLFIVSGR